jgi:hypothetical protein
MKPIHTLLGTALIALASSPVLANDWDGNHEMQSSILNDHARGYVGTSIAAAKPAGRFDNHHELRQSVINDVTREGYRGFVGTSLTTAKPAGRWDSHHELRQSVLNDF